jgi:hypothetical protein
MFTDLHVSSRKPRGKIQGSLVSLFWKEPEYGGDTFVRNVGKRLQQYMTSQLKRPHSVQPEPEMLSVLFKHRLPANEGSYVYVDSGRLYIYIYIYVWLRTLSRIPYASLNWVMSFAHLKWQRDSRWPCPRPDWGCSAQNYENIVLTRSRNCKGCSKLEFFLTFCRVTEHNSEPSHHRLILTFFAGNRWMLFKSRSPQSNTSILKISQQYEGLKKYTTL